MNDTPISINYHLYKPCNARCRFCFATFRDVDGTLGVDAARRLLAMLREAGGEKLTFVGGEPTLHPHIAPLIEHAKELGFTTCIVTNGARLAPLVEQHASALDWVGFSVDSAREQVEVALGRSRNGHYVADSIALAEKTRAAGIRIKLNTVVTALNHDEDMSALLRQIRPERWKVFQVLPIEGQNDGAVEDLLISRAQFLRFLERHRSLTAEGYGPIAEDNDAMRGSYVMIDPLGRFYGNSTGRHVYSDPILDIGVKKALAQVDFSAAKLLARGGLYDWAGRLPRT